MELCELDLEGIKSSSTLTYLVFFVFCTFFPGASVHLHFCSWGRQVEVLDNHQHRWNTLQDLVLMSSHKRASSNGHNGTIYHPEGVIIGPSLGLLPQTSKWLPSFS